MLTVATLQFLYFGGWSLLSTHTRPFEPLFRDPWWIFTVLNLFWNIKHKYEFGYIELMRVSPRFGILLAAMVLSLCFMIVDILSVTHAIPSHGLPDGINPFWKFSYLFKCLTDTIVSSLTNIHFHTKADANDPCSLRDRS